MHVLYTWTVNIEVYVDLKCFLSTDFCVYVFCNCSFTQVKINFLMVGHTHEIIDQLFSRLGVEIRKSNLLTFDGVFQSQYYTLQVYIKKVKHRLGHGKERIK